MLAEYDEAAEVEDFMQVALNFGFLSMFGTHGTKCGRFVVFCVSFSFFPQQVGEAWAVFSPTAESFGVSAQIGFGVVRGPEVRFHQGSTRFCEGCGAVGDIT